MMLWAMDGYEIAKQRKDRTRKVPLLRRSLPLREPSMKPDARRKRFFCYLACSKQIQEAAQTDRQPRIEHTIPSNMKAGGIDEETVRSRANLQLAAVVCKRCFCGSHVSIVAQVGCTGFRACGGRRGCRGRSGGAGAGSAGRRRAAQTASRHVFRLQP